MKYVIADHEITELAKEVASAVLRVATWEVDEPANITGQMLEKAAKGVLNENGIKWNEVTE